jgi:hypothetical protein
MTEPTQNAPTDSTGNSRTGSTTETTTGAITCDCRHTPANKRISMPSFTSWGKREGSNRKVATSGGLFLRTLQLAALCAIFFAIGCGNETPTTKSEPAPAPKPAEPAVPDDIQSAAQSLLGTETTVLVFGDLAKTGRQQFLAANVVPKSTRNQLPGTIVTRAVVGENEDGQWTEIFRCDEHLKNSKGFLAGTPMADVTGWRIAYEQNPEKGLQLYLTPLKGGTDDPHSLPIGVRWNPKAKRYQSLDRTYENFLTESANMGGGTPKSTLR